MKAAKLPDLENTKKNNLSPPVEIKLTLDQLKDSPYDRIIKGEQVLLEDEILYQDDKVIAFLS